MPSWFSGKASKDWKNTDVEAFLTPESRKALGIRFFRKWRALEEQYERAIKKGKEATQFDNFLNSFPFLIGNKKRPIQEIQSCMENHWNSLGFPLEITPIIYSKFIKELKVRALAVIKSPDVYELLIDFTGSNGGNFDPGLTMFEEMVKVRVALERSGKKLIAFSCGQTSSMAVPSFLAASERFVAGPTEILIHPVAQNSSSFDRLGRLTSDKVEGVAKELEGNTQTYCRLMAQEMVRETSINIEDKQSELYDLITKVVRPSDYADPYSHDITFSGRNAISAGFANEWIDDFSDFIASYAIKDKPINMDTVVAGPQGKRHP